MLNISTSVLVRYSQADRSSCRQAEAGGFGFAPGYIFDMVE